jgi:hypothetical protein
MATDTAITPMMDLTNYRSMGSGKSRRVTVTPEQSGTVTVSSSSTVDSFFSIPSSRYSVINPQGCYLQFDYAITGTTTAGTVTASAVSLGPSNGSTQSFIRTLELTAQGQSVELLDNYNVWACIMDDFQSGGRSKGLLSISEGSNAAILNSTPADGTTSTTLAVQLNTQSLVKQPFIHTSAQVYRSCIPLYSSVIGTLAETYIPAADGLRLRVSWDNYLKGCVGATVTALSITNLKLHLDFIDIDPAVMMNLAKEGNGLLKSHMTGVTNFQVSGASGDAAISALIPARYSSVKFLMNSWRASAAADAPKNDVGNRFYPALDTYSINIGGRQYPPTAISCRTTSGVAPAEVLMELGKVFGQIHSPQLETVFGYNEFVSTGVAAVPGTASFVCGLCFEEYSGANRVVSGLDTNSSNMYIQTTHNASVGAAYLLDTFVGYDMILEYDVASGALSFSK